MRPLVQVSNLHFSYGSREVLRGASFEINRAESVLLLGENGAGKTTLLSCLIGLMRPAVGRVSVRGFAAAAHLSGYVGEPAFFCEKSGYFQLQAAAWMSGTRVERAEVVRVCRDVGLALEALEQRVATYSSGMRKKLAIARALLAESDLLIVDEPMNGLDPTGVDDLRGALNTARREKGTTLLISSHSIAEAQRWATRALVLHQGVIADDLPLPEPAQLHGADPGFRCELERRYLTTVRGADGVAN